jgi:ankyrin repeat protein
MKKILSRAAAAPLAVALILPLLGATSLSAFAAPLPLPVMQQEAKPEAAATARLISVALPSGAFRLTDEGALEELKTQLQTIATEGGFTVGTMEAIMWGGPDHNEARNKSIKTALIQTLKKGGYEHEVAGEQKTDEGLFTLFVVGKANAKQGVMGFWLANEKYLMLVWAKMIPGKDKGETPETPKKGGDILPPSEDGKKPVSTEDKNVKAALETAVEEGTAEDVKALLNKGADANTLTEGGQTLLLRAVVRGDKEITTALLEGGANPEKGGAGNRSPLFTAAMTGKTALIELLLEKKAKVNGASPEGMTALHGAAITGQVGATKLLLAKGADISAKNAKGQTALQIAEQSKNAEVAELLRAAAEK